MTKEMHETTRETTNVTTTANKPTVDHADTPIISSKPAVLSQRDVVRRERMEFGGIKIGSAFFGWVTATGIISLLAGLLAAGGTAIALATTNTTDQINTTAQNNAETIGWLGAITLLGIAFIGYYAGGYVAGRMARFQGMRQGMAVWLWGVLGVLVAALLVAVAGADYNVFSTLNLPRIPIEEGNLTNMGIFTMAGVAIVSLLGAIAGGLAGMRFHRRVDKAGLRDVVVTGEKMM